MLGTENDSDSKPSIMEPMESLTHVKAELSDAMNTDILNKLNLKSIPYISTEFEEEYECNNKRSFLLIDSNENLLVSTSEIFCKKLNCHENDQIKVISIFGNTGDGKSHTMNHTFFQGAEIFCTSSEPNSCTIGVWAAIQKKLGILCLDTEGLLGTTTDVNRRMRMLLKVLAVSDIVIFRTRSEKLHHDMFQFLGTASKAFCKHFSSALKSVVAPSSDEALGPAVIIFHETRHTKPLECTVEESAEDIIRNKFSKMNLDTDAFNSLRYIGIQTEGPVTDYSKLLEAIRFEIENTAVRSPRPPLVVFQAMRALNLKFAGEIKENSINPFPEQYFTCPKICISCNRRCQRSSGHVLDGDGHTNANLCIFQNRYGNKILLCSKCFRNGKKILVVIKNYKNNYNNSWYNLAKYAWSGSVIECPDCGEIYRSKQLWYGSESPEDEAVRSEVIHVWGGDCHTTRSVVYSAQMVFDGVSYITEAISNIGSKPSKAVTNWVADKIAPSYWKPNGDIIHCHSCKAHFLKTGLGKHHCRSCGEGFCNTCTKHRLPVPLRGWDQPVRVCDSCRKKLIKKQNSVLEKPSYKNIESSSSTIASNDGNDIMVRKYGEVVYNTLSSVAAALEYPKDIIKDTVRPSYWVPDIEAPNCAVCNIMFGTAEQIENAKSKEDCNNSELTTQYLNGDCRRHHCRACGQAVCHKCSTNRKPVPERGWKTEVRVCDLCIDKLVLN